MNEKAAQRQAWTDLICKRIAGGRGAPACAPSGGPTHRSAQASRLAPHASRLNDRALWTMSEEVWQEQVEQIATLCGWKHYHTHDSRKSEEGFPDLIMMRPPRLVVPELKKMGEVPSLKQWEWLRLFEMCGAEIYVWRPCDFDTVSKVLR